METASPPSQSAPGGRILALDGLRGIAALTVLMVHYQAMLGQTALPLGQLAVDFFFLLSGFVLVPVFEGNRASFVPAMAGRFVRFWPLIAIGAVLGAAVHLLRWPPETVLPLLAMAWLCLPFGFDGHPWYSLNLPQWSLFIELVANAAHLLLLRHLPSKVLLALAAACTVVLAVTGRQVGAFDGVPGGELALALIRAGATYPLGIAMGRARHRLTALPRSAWWMAPCGFVAAIVLPPWLGLPGPLAELVACLAFPCILVLGVTADVPAQRVPTMNWLGMISFPLYATHFPLIEGIGLYARGLPPLARMPLLLATLAAALLLADRLGRRELARAKRVPASARLSRA